MKDTAPRRKIERIEYGFRPNKALLEAISNLMPGPVFDRITRQDPYLLKSRAVLLDQSYGGDPIAEARDRLPDNWKDPQSEFSIANVLVAKSETQVAYDPNKINAIAWSFRFVNQIEADQLGRATRNRRNVALPKGELFLPVRLISTHNNKFVHRTITQRQMQLGVQAAQRILNRQGNPAHVYGSPHIQKLSPLELPATQ